ncbi:MAG: hypothetical protein V2A58_06945 [Planctomycetota bacterium]
MPMTMQAPALLGDGQAAPKGRSHPRFVLSALSVVCLCSAAFADNLLTNSDFKRGSPGSPDFAWTVDLAKNQRSECTVVEGRRPDATVLLVSDYSPAPARATVSAPGDEPLLVKDLHSGEEVAQLTRQQRKFPVELKRDLTARLYLLRTPRSK